MFRRDPHSDEAVVRRSAAAKSNATHLADQEVEAALASTPSPPSHLADVSRGRHRTYHRRHTPPSKTASRVARVASGAEATRPTSGAGEKLAAATAAAAAEASEALNAAKMEASETIAAATSGASEKLADATNKLAAMIRRSDQLMKKLNLQGKAMDMMKELIGNATDNANNDSMPSIIEHSLERQGDGLVKAFMSKANVTEDMIEKALVDPEFQENGNELLKIIGGAMLQKMIQKTRVNQTDVDDGDDVLKVVGDALYQARWDPRTGKYGGDLTQKMHPQTCDPNKASAMHSKQDIRMKALRVVLLIAGSVGLGRLIETHFLDGPKEKFVSLGVVAMFVICYLILIPSIVDPTIIMKIEFTEPASLITLDCLADRCGPGYLLESMWSIITGLFDIGSPAAGCLVAFYGIGVPIAKLILLVAAMYFLRCEDDDRQVWARKCIKSVRFISKWDSPKLVCYALLLCIMGQFNWYPVIATTVELDVGFCYYMIFCVCTLIGSLLLPLPAEPASRRVVKKPSAWVESTVQWGILPATLIMFALFAFLLYTGMFAAMFTVRMDLSTSEIIKYAYAPLLPEVQALNMPSWASSDVSMSSCVTLLMTRAIEGDVNGFMSWVILAVFVVGFTILNMLVLVLVASHLRDDTSHTKRKKTKQTAQQWLRIAHWLKYMSMLDVAIMGTWLMLLTGTPSWKAAGITVDSHGGLMVLLAAEVVHYATYYTVSHAMEVVERRDNVAADLAG